MRKITYFIAALALLGSTQFANAQEPTMAAPTPTYPEADVISFYGKTYEPASDHKLILRTNWGLSPDNFVDDYINKDAVLHMINLELPGNGRCLQRNIRLESQSMEFYRSSYRKLRLDCGE